MKNTQFSFLICSERSGSNLLLNILNTHSCVCAPPPSHLFRLFSTNAQNYGRLDNNSNWATLLSDFVDAFENQLGQWQTTISDSSLGELCAVRHALEPVRAVYELEATQAAADHVFVKENHTAQFALDLLAFLPSSRFVHMVRDPRDVAASYLSTDGIPGGVERAVQVWLADQSRTKEVGKHPDLEPLVLKIRYEDLIASPEAVLTRLMSHLNLAFEADMLNFHRSKQVRNNVSRVAAWNNLAQPIMQTNSGKFADSLTDAEIEYVELACRDLMVEHGYDPALIRSPTDSRHSEERLARLLPELRSGNYQLGSDDERAVRQRRLAVIDRVTARRLR